VHNEAGREAPQLLFPPGSGLMDLTAGAVHLREGEKEGERKIRVKVRYMDKVKVRGPLFPPPSLPTSSDSASSVV